MAITSGSAPSIAAKRRHHDRPEARKAGLVNRLRRRQPALAFAVEREVHHHDAVLLDDADQQDDADEGDHRQLGAGTAASASSAPRPADGSVEMMVSGCARLSYSTPSTI